MPSSIDIPIKHQIGDVCGVAVLDGCKMCADHCKKPAKCAVHKHQHEGELYGVSSPNHCEVPFNLHGV